MAEIGARDKIVDKTKYTLIIIDATILVSLISESFTK